METPPVEDRTGVFLKQWESQVRPYIEMIDYLRRIGIEKDLALPSIAVVGDQSSGKSSVLEALSGVALPRGSGKSSSVCRVHKHKARHVKEITPMSQNQREEKHCRCFDCLLCVEIVFCLGRNVYSGL